MLLARILLVALAFGALIFVHELGHFFAAKRVGVRVEVFSLGFGPFLLSWKRGDTTYAVSLIPFGGYVRMTGQADAGQEDQDVPSYHWNAKPPLQRVLVLVCGVAMNMVFAYLLFVAIYLVGIRVTPPKVGPLDPDGESYEAGLRGGDVFIEIDGRKPFRYEDIIVVFSMGKGTKRALVRRGESTFELALPSFADPESTPAAYPPPVVERPLRIGCTGKKRVLVSGVGEDSPAEKAGILPGDIILTVESRQVYDVPEVRSAVASKGGAEIELVLVRAGTELPALRVRPVPNEDRDLSPARFLLGVNLETPIWVETVQPGSPADRAGLRPFDVVDLGGLKEMDDGRVMLSWRRGSESMGPEVLETSPDYAALSVPEREQVFDRRSLVWKEGRPGALLMGFSECSQTVRTTFGVFWAIVTGRIEPSKGLGGPISIAVHAYAATRVGADYYVWLVAALSAMIGVFNLFPVPPLDGGLLVFVALEKIRGRPAARRTREIAQTIGIVLFLMLIAYVSWIDVGRVGRWLGR